MNNQQRKRQHRFVTNRFRFVVFSTFNILYHSAFSLKRQRFTEILNDIKRQMIQLSVLKEIEFFFTASARFLKFVYARIVIEEKKTEV